MAGVASISVFLGEAGVFAFYKSLLINRKEAISIGKPYPGNGKPYNQKTLTILAAFTGALSAEAATTTTFTALTRNQMFNGITCTASTGLFAGTGAAVSAPGNDSGTTQFLSSIACTQDVGAFDLYRC